jgi:adenine C2-methylase RlmN of 23S rRNA A2503 and tRNA A37
MLQRWLAAGLVTRVDKETRAKDGTVKLLLALRDGKKVETVAMPIGACCVSTQVGCAVGCRFCASGLFGVERHLAVDEIVEQVVHARRHMRIDRIVFMGMGEPSHNLDNVMAAVARIHEEALISPKRQTFSTVGGVKPLARMREFAVKPCLALSLHSANEQRRRELLPRAHKDPLPEIVAAADAYAQDVGTPIQFEWTMLAGINDSDQDVDELCALLQGVREQFTPANPSDDEYALAVDFVRRETRQLEQAFAGELAARRVDISHAQFVQAACRAYAYREDMLARDPGSFSSNLPEAYVRRVSADEDEGVIVIERRQPLAHVA